MNNKKLAFLLKLFVVILAALGLVLFGLCIPSLLHELILFYRRTLNEELPLQLLSATAAVILYIALILFWRICTRIGRNRSFCHENAEGLRWICKLAFFNLALTAILAVGLYLLGLEDFFGFTLVVYGAGNALFVLYDVALTRLISVYYKRFRR